MQTSAKTKAKEFCKWQELPEHVQDALEKLLLEHGRDTRYTVIDILHGMEDEECYDHSFEVINRSLAVQLVHNLNVGE